MTTQFDMACAGRTLWQEARGEPAIGITAVAHTLVNRVNDGRWGKSLAEVCLFDKQFSGWNWNDPNFAAACRLADDYPPLVALTAYVTRALQGEADPTEGALFYYATYLELSSPPHIPLWSRKMNFIGTFGHQKFFTDKPWKSSASV